MNKFKPKLEVGQIFDTLYEKGCKVITLPDEFGNFDAYDSDGVACSFNIRMVKE